MVQRQAEQHTPTTNNQNGGTWGGPAAARRPGLQRGAGVAGDGAREGGQQVRAGQALRRGGPGGRGRARGGGPPPAGPPQDAQLARLLLASRAHRHQVARAVAQQRELPGQQRALQPGPRPHPAPQPSHQDQLLPARPGPAGPGGGGAAPGNPTLQLSLSS